ncbi:spore coat protein GerQ [Paenibacillus sp.]|uniref:spore coat protein GerQ n=1 Tax=Paenibacillus sp. TaxID=58172 RepID=UPI002837E209|nr:spore coat protein GerQ [Paenibacillus sp.]MDR0267552.1 spore coat protein GerQ [Paenibacillus sp.]
MMQPFTLRPAPYGGGYPGVSSSGTMPSGMPMTTPTAGSTITPTGTVIQPTSQAMLEQSFVENILRLNRGKVGTFYMTYENNSQWNAKIFRGRIEAAGRDHIIISDSTTGQRIILLMLNLDYITFDEPINYQYPAGTPGLTR